MQDTHAGVGSAVLGRAKALSELLPWGSYQCDSSRWPSKARPLVPTARILTLTMLMPTLCSYFYAY